MFNVNQLSTIADFDFYKQENIFKILSNLKTNYKKFTKILQILRRNLTEIIINFKNNLRKFLSNFKIIVKNCENILENFTKIKL